MKYIQTQFCKGTFILERSINLDNLLNPEDQKIFFTLKDMIQQGKEEELSEKDFDWFQNILEQIGDGLSFAESHIVSYDVEDWEEFESENMVVE